MMKSLLLGFVFSNFVSNAVFAFVGQQFLNSSTGSCSYTATCTAESTEGVCVSVSSGCCSTGKVTAGLCPGSSDIMCCTKPSCSTPVGTGQCMQTSSCSGKSISGYCTGPSDIQCCVAATDDTPQDDYYHNNWCGGSLQYLDDKYCAKKFPSSFNREWSCPVTVLEEAPTGYFPDGPLAQVEIDTKTLDGIVTSGANLCMIVTKRVRAPESTSGVRLVNKYYCAGAASAEEVWETWSSSKIFTMANAARHLRSNETKCTAYATGLDATTTGKKGTTPLGDLATVVVSYDHTAGYTSNSLSSFFHDMGWRSSLHDLVQSDWLGLSGLSLGGNYGEATPSDLSLTLTPAAAGAAQCTADKDPWPKTFDNSLSALAAAEMTRRLVQHREVDAKLRYPGMQWADAQTEMYGAATSLLFPGLEWGGMTADTAIYLQSALDIEAIEKASGGTWRIFSKLGAGYSTMRSRGEIVSNAYACLPSGATSAAAGGLEFTITVRGSIPNDGTLLKAENQVITAMRQAVQALIDGVIG